MTRKVPLLVEQPALHRFHAEQARKRGPVNAEHGVRRPLDADVRQKLRALLRELQRVEELERELAVHRVALPEERGDEDPERDRLVRPRPRRHELEPPRVHGDRRVEADLVEVEGANRLLKKKRRLGDGVGPAKRARNLDGWANRLDVGRAEEGARERRGRLDPHDCGRGRRVQRARLRKLGRVRGRTREKGDRGEDVDAHRTFEQLVFKILWI